MPRRLLVGLGAIAVFGAITLQIAGNGGASEWERQLAHDLYGRSSSAHDAIDTALHLGRLGGAALLGGLVAGLAARGRRRAALFVMASMFGALVVDQVAKMLFAGVRLDPPGNDTFAPSGHAIASVVLVGSVVFLCWRARERALVGALGTLAIVVYGAALVARNWHYPSEVGAGWALGVAWLAIVSSALPFLGKRLPKPAAALGTPAGDLEHGLGGTREQRSFHPGT